MIRNAKPEDAEAIVEIYNHYILHTVVTFEEVCIDAEEMKRRIQAISARFPWIVYEEAGRVLGYAYASEWKSRSAYQYSAESTVYLQPGAGGKGIGSALYGELLRLLREMGLHAVMGGIALPNEASARLHEKLGFEKVAHFREVGYKFGRWVDVGYWEVVFGERE